MKLLRCLHPGPAVAAAALGSKSEHGRSLSLLILLSLSNQHFVKSTSRGADRSVEAQRVESPLAVPLASQVGVPVHLPAALLPDHLPANAPEGDSRARGCEPSFPALSGHQLGAGPDAEHLGRAPASMWDVGTNDGELDCHVTVGPASAHF